MTERVAEPRVWLVAALLGAAACGGGSGPDAEDPTSGGQRTAGGAVITEEVREAWQDAVALYRRLAQAGTWNEQTCGQARDGFEEANDEQGGQFTEAIYMLGLLSERCGDGAAAREFYNRALSINDGYCKARAAIGVLQMDEGQLGPAEQTFRRAIEGDPRCTEAYVNLAIIQRGRGGTDVREALNNLRRALAIESEYLPAFNQMALLYLQIAESTDNAQMLDLAGVVCRQAQLIDSEYAPIYNTWGLVSVEQEDINQAIRFFQRAVELDSGMFEAYMNFGQTTLSFRGYEDAQRSFARAVELRPNSYEAHLGLGAAYRGLRQMDQAQAEYERAREIDSARPEAFFNLGLLYQDYRGGSIGDLRRAKEFYEQFLAKAGNEFSETVEAVRRSCDQQQSRRRRRRSTDCRPGRLQNIRNTIEALEAAAQMQQQMQQQGGGQ